VHSVIPPTIGELEVGAADDVVVGGAPVVVGGVVVGGVFVGSAGFSPPAEQPAVAASTTDPRVAMTERFMGGERTGDRPNLRRG